MTLGHSARLTGLPANAHLSRRSATSVLLAHFMKAEPPVCRQGQDAQELSHPQSSSETMKVSQVDPWQILARTEVKVSLTARVNHCPESLQT